jgi:hypothetical protein
VPKYRDPMALADKIKKDLDDFFEKKKRGRVRSRRRQRRIRCIL